MRLTSSGRLTIRDTVRTVVGAGARVRLFGSRTDDSARGGDIDLLVELDYAVERPVVVSARIGARLQSAWGDRRIDVLLLAPNVTEQVVHRLARATGVDV